MTTLVRTTKALFIAMGLLSAVSLHAADPVDTETLSEREQAFYFLGTTLSRNLESLALTEDEQVLVVQGLRDAMANEAEAPIDGAKYSTILNQVAGERMAAIAAKEAEQAAAYLEKMAAESGAVVSDSGLIYLELDAGDGAQPAAASTVTAHYEGVLRSGQVFDSSYQRGEPLQIRLTDVIPCWTEGIAMMKVGGRSKITCPADIAYGDRATGPIPPGSALTFTVELLGVEE